jgi:uncharacterized membrane protein
MAYGHGHTTGVARSTKPHTAKSKASALTMAQAIWQSIHTQQHHGDFAVCAACQEHLTAAQHDVA